MAKWGEGDPRWIVEERPDATNVNNWHWTEKNATPWSKDQFQELFKDLKIVQDGFECLVDSIEKCNGEATANNRKGKLIFFYEWDLVLTWQGQLSNSDDIWHKGKISIPNLSEENDLDDIEITVTVDKSNDDSEKLKLFMYNVGRDRIRDQLSVYIKSLKEEYSKNLILPKKGDGTISTQDKTIQFDSFKDNLSLQQTKSYSKSIGCKLDVRTLSMVEEFHCRAMELYQVLTKADRLSAFTRSPAKAESIRGGEFHLYGGNVHGKFEELEPPKKITLSWRLKSWPTGHFSKVVIELEEQTSCTQLKLCQVGIPASEYESMHSNWHRYYWHSIKQTFGFGVALTDIF